MSGSGTRRRRHEREVRRRHERTAQAEAVSHERYYRNNEANRWWGDLFHAMSVRRHVQSLNDKYIAQQKAMRRG